MSTSEACLLRDLVVEQVSPNCLKAYEANARTHTKLQIRKIADSIKTFGWTNPILVDAQDRVIAGHGRLEATKLLGLKLVPILRIEDLSETQIKAYVIADNRLAELAGWDEEILAKELQLLTELDIDFNIEVTGFEMGEIDVLLEDQTKDHSLDPADDIPEINLGKPISSPGDVWVLGRHRLVCGDALRAESFKMLMEGHRAQMVFVDPPYNVSTAQILSAKGCAKHPNFLMAAGEMSSEQFITFLTRALAHHATFSEEGSIAFICMDWRHLGELLCAGKAVYSELKNVCVWKKTNAGMGSLYRSQHELVFVFQHGKGTSINNVQLGTYGRNRTNVWEYPGQTVPTQERLDSLAMHPTVKPTALVQDAILDCSKRGGIVLDGFAGSGTTLIAAERIGRRGFGLELDPRYVDVALRRFRKCTGIEPVHQQSGLTFKTLESQDN